MKQSINRKGDKYHQIEYGTKNNDIMKVPMKTAEGIISIVRGNWRKASKM